MRTLQYSRIDCFNGIFIKTRGKQMQYRWGALVSFTSASLFVVTLAPGGAAEPSEGKESPWLPAGLLEKRAAETRGHSGPRSHCSNRRRFRTRIVAA